MRLVVTMGVRNLPARPRPLSDLYREFLDESVYAEELGFDAVWASEHHFSEDVWNPSPLTFLTAVAARTRRVRVGPYVLLLPLHNPVRVAEDIAVLDNISGGRVDLPVGVGSAREEFRTFGLPFGERLGRTFEALRIIERCFAGEAFTHRGKYYSFPDLRMTTTPVQKPGPPIWVASMGEQSVAWTARRGYHLAAGAGPGHQLYEELLIRHGHDRSTHLVASGRGRRKRRHAVYCRDRGRGGPCPRPLPRQALEPPLPQFSSAGYGYERSAARDGDLCARADAGNQDVVINGR